MSSELDNERRLTRVEVQLEIQKETLQKLTEATSQLTIAVTNSINLKQDMDRLHARVDEIHKANSSLKTRITQIEGVLEPLKGIDDTVKKNDLISKAVVAVVVLIFGGFVTTLFSIWQGYLTISPGGP